MAGNELVPTGGGQELAISPQYVENAKQSLALLQTMVKSSLIEGRDYGSVPGIPGRFLFDPGASQVISAFNCHPGERKIIHLIDSDEKIAVIVEVPIINNRTQMQVGSGVGAASTLETKHKYRWVSDPVNWGYSEETIPTLRKKQDDNRTMYRINNPEHGELLNTIIKMASKRAEVDACETLPGVASALRELFDKKFRRRFEPEGDRQDWDSFWGEINKMGLSRDEVHGILQVEGMKDWLATGQTLEQAIESIRDYVSTAEASQVIPPGETTETSGPASVRAYKRDPSKIKSYTALLKACNEDFKMQPAQVLAELNVNSTHELEADKKRTPELCYLTIANVR